MASFAYTRPTPPRTTPRDARDTVHSDGVAIAAGGGPNRMLWPTTHFASFSRMTPSQPNVQTLKIIRPPQVYVATHDTMPPQQQVIRTVPIHDLLRQHYQQIDRKMTGKRDATSAEPEITPQGEPRPAKTPRAR